MPQTNSHLIADSIRSAHARHSMQSMRRQTGMSMFGWLVVLGAAAFAVSISLKVVPHYMDNRAVTNILDGVSPEVWRGPNKKKMHETVNKGLKVNSIRTLKSADIIEIERTPSLTKVVMDYEIRENLFGNVDVVLVFKKDYQF